MTVETDKLPFTFEIVQESGEQIWFWLLFVNERLPDYDIQVTDYVGTYPNPSSAAKAYENSYPARPPALIALYDGNNLDIKYRVDRFDNDEPAEEIPGWYYAYDEESYE